MLIHYFDLVAFQDGNIHKLSQFVSGMVFDNEQSRCSDFQDKTQSRDSAGRPPNAKLVSLPPNAQMDSGALDCRSDPREGNRIQRQRPIERKWNDGLFRREEG